MLGVQECHIRIHYCRSESQLPRTHETHRKLRGAFNPLNEGEAYRNYDAARETAIKGSFKNHVTHFRSFSKTTQINSKLHFNNELNRSSFVFYKKLLTRNCKIKNT